MTAVADILETAADILDQPGAWCQNQLYINSPDTNEQPVIGNDSGGQFIVSACLVGGIRLAASQLLGTIRRREGAELLVQSALSAVMLSGDMGSPADWNDTPERTQGEVVDALRLAAKDVRNGTVGR